MSTDSATIAYVARNGARPYYYANAHDRDAVPLDPRAMPLIDGRRTDPRLDREGFACLPHVSAVADFTDRDAVAAVYADEIVALVRAATGADAVMVTAPGIVRFSEASGRAGTRDNSHPARFVHIDQTDATAAQFAARTIPAGRPAQRWAHYNVWRAFSGAPQDVSLALCDMTSVDPADRIEADAIFDPPGGDEWRFASWVLAANPAHRWHWFPDLSRDEVLLFQSSDSLTGHAVPHVAFDNRHTAPGCTPRASIEMRCLALWDH
ncbi:CmcJ/NvfI family oxidoreductase [Novosphingobium sp.]|uniref:CmcJ/NvfI family oxidoreductase n=1 Tax=Novosphingobium sp. TaxID=1874826 RepID=UPI00333F5ABD